LSRSPLINGTLCFRAVVAVGKWVMFVQLVHFLNGRDSLLKLLEFSEHDRPAESGGCFRVLHSHSDSGLIKITKAVTLLFFPLSHTRSVFYAAPCRAELHCPKDCFCSRGCVNLNLFPFFWTCPDFEPTM
jgi:hypothetical protein